MSDDLKTWKSDRKAALEAEDGWLNLIARIDLPEGRHRVGAADDCEIRLPHGPDHMGEIIRNADSTDFTPLGGHPQPFKTGAGGFPILKAPPFLFEFHDPGGHPALRVRDLTIPRSIALDHFPFAPDWRITAAWLPLSIPQEIEIGQKGGSDTNVTLTHEARFRVGDQDVSLVPTHWKGGKPMFVFRDKTSGSQTYAASRFLIGEVTSHDTIVLDFNRAHNPPCAFTDFAICPLPPPGNVLPFAVRAGELAPQPDQARAISR